MVLTTARELPAQYSVIRLSSNAAFECIVLSPLVGLRVHFDRSSLICPRTDCPACGIGRNTKYAGYLVVWADASRRLLRLTEQAARSVERLGIAQPGSIWSVTKAGSRRPLQISELKFKEVPPHLSCSTAHVLRRLALLHTLGVIDEDFDDSQVELEVERRARALLSGMLVQ